MYGAAEADLPARLRRVLAVDRPGNRVGPRPSPSDPPPRRAAVLILFAAGPDGQGEVLLTQRATGMRSHPGQVAFPGGAVDPEDDGPVAAALREAWEETGLDPAGVQILGVMADRYMPPAHVAVTPVVGWWRTPSPVRVVDPREVARVAAVPLPALVDPAARFTTRLRHGYTGPAFNANGFFVWGFTAGLLSHLLDVSGLERPWNREIVRPIPE